MRLLFKIISALVLLYSVFAVSVALLVMFAKENTANWRGYLREGMESVPEAVLVDFLGIAECPVWVTALYWFLLLVYVCWVWMPKRR